MCHLVGQSISDVYIGSVYLQLLCFQENIKLFKSKGKRKICDVTLKKVKIFSGLGKELVVQVNTVPKLFLYLFILKFDSEQSLYTAYIKHRKIIQVLKVKAERKNKAPARKIKLSW